MFVDKLIELADGESKLISNRSLRDALGWDEPRYLRIRKELLNQSKIIIGRGYGGSVGLASAPGAKALTVFISYTHTDETYKSELIKHLEPLKKRQLIETWHDRKLKAGEPWDKTISANLDVADIILLLVSIDFINSPYCYDVELERALERHEAGTARVVPVILRPCMWQQAPFSALQALPKDAQAVSLWPDRDQALVNVAEGVRQIAEEMLALS
ncbi:MAG: toll/interleukin-1 receptor domain-containing protein [Ignavibacteriota bacterium]